MRAERLKIYTVSFIFGASVCLLPAVSHGGSGGNVKLIDTTSYHSGLSRALDSQIEEYLQQKKYKDSIALLKKELEKDPYNSEILYKEAEIYSDIEDYYKAIRIIRLIEQLKPNDKKTLKLKKIVEEKIKELPHNEVGFLQDESYLNDINGYWSFSSLHYYKLTGRGSFGGRINYENRYGTNAEQYLFEAYPKFNDDLSASIILGYANTTQITFPNFQYKIEPYFSLPNDFQLSIGQSGQKYITFDNQWISSYTVSLGRYYKNCYLWIKPSYWTPTDTTFTEAGIRKYFSDEFNYISFKFSSGRLPDIGDLPPLANIIIVRQTGVNFDVGFSVAKRWIIKTGIGYTNQVFLPSMHLRNITDIAFGVDYRY